MNLLPTPDLAMEQRIWRYIDVAKFVLLLTTKSLYFPSISELAKSDPYEGFVARSHREVISSAWENGTGFPPSFENAVTAAAAIVGEGHVNNIRTHMAFRMLSLMFGASCWHGNDGESEAMWKLYSSIGAGIAIESTVGRLSNALRDLPACSICKVRYLDFEEPLDPTGPLHYLICKRKSYEHEKEVRAVIQFSNPGCGGIKVPCDLEALIARVHIAPAATVMFEEAVRSMCDGSIYGLRFEVVKSDLLSPPAL